MKLYLDQIAPNARRVAMFVEEKGLKIDVVDVDVAAGANRTADFLAKNPLGQVPVLELDDGTCICESMAICRYLNDTAEGDSLFGASTSDRALVEMWSRRAEFGVFIPAVEYGHHSQAFFADRFVQSTDIAELFRSRIEQSYQFLEQELATRDHLAGARFSIADVNAYCGVELARVWGIALPESHENLSGWYQRVAARPSAVSARYLEP
jgi:glutathione S-transferase